MSCRSARPTNPPPTRVTHYPKTPPPTCWLLDSRRTNARHTPVGPKGPPLRPPHAIIAGMVCTHDPNAQPGDNFCQQCGKQGHFAVVCRQKAPQSVQQATLGHLYLHQTEKADDHLISILVTLHNDCQHEIRWLPDSGADVDALSAQDFHRLGPDLQHHLVPDRQLVRAANGGELGSLGTLSATLALNGRSCHTTLHIYPQLSTSFLSKATCIQLGLLEVGWPQSRLAKAAALSVEPPPQAGVSPPPMAVDPYVSALKNSIMAEFPSVFQDAPLRSMAGPPMHITLRSDAVPCRHYRARAIPFQWRDAVEGQLSSMESKGVIEKVPVCEPFTWCHPMVVVPKKASVEPPDHCRLDRDRKVRRAPGLSNPAQRRRCQHPSGYALLHYLGLTSRVLADTPGRRELQADYIHHPLRRLSLPAQCHGPYLGWRRTQLSRRRSAGRLRQRPESS